MPDELWIEVRDTVQKTGIKTIPMEKKCKKAKWLSEEALQIPVQRREGKSTRPFKYDLNLVPNNYTVKVTNRFKGLNLIECLMNYGWRFMTLYRRQGARPSPRKRNAKRQNGCLRKPYK